jgi:hypothetical protein
MGFILEVFLDKVVRVKLSITAHRLHVRSELRVFALKFGIGRLGHETIVHAQEVAVDGLSGSVIAPKCTMGSIIPGILRAYNGHVAGVNGGHLRSPLVTRDHTKTLVNKGFWDGFPEHPQRYSNPCRHLDGLMKLNLD